MPRLMPSAVAGAEPVLDLPDLAAIPAGGFACLAANPSCQRGDVWWMGWFDEDADAARQFVTFRPLGPDLRVQQGLAEAVLWAWISPTGHDLLSGLRSFGLTIILAPQASVGPATTIAAYRTQGHLILVSTRYAKVSSWVLGDVVVHELTHARQDQTGQLQSASVAGCEAAEIGARQSAVAYARWVAGHFGTLPTLAEVGQSLSAEDSALIAMIAAEVAAPDLRPIAAAECEPDSGQPAGSATPRSRNAVTFGRGRFQTASGSVCAANGPSSPVRTQPGGGARRRWRCAAAAGSCAGLVLTDVRSKDRRPDMETHWKLVLQRAQALRAEVTQRQQHLDHFSGKALRQEMQAIFRLEEEARALFQQADALECAVEARALRLGMTVYKLRIPMEWALPFGDEPLSTWFARPLRITWLGRTQADVVRLDGQPFPDGSRTQRERRTDLRRTPVRF